MERPSVKIGDKIRIISLTDEPFNSNYIGKTGTITKFGKDCYGCERMDGTWGGIWIYLKEDEYEIVDS